MYWAADSEVALYIPVFGASISGHFRLKMGPFPAPLHTPAPPEAAARRLIYRKLLGFRTLSPRPPGRGQPRRMEPAASARGPLATSDGRQWGFTCQSAKLREQLGARTKRHATWSPCGQPVQAEHRNCSRTGSRFRFRAEHRNYKTDRRFLISGCFRQLAE